jgi:hypothetical protein
MIYSVHGFNAQKLAEYKLTNDDALILSFTLKFFSSGKMKTVVINDTLYFWLFYQHVIDELYPIIKLQCRRAIRNKFENYCKIGILNFKLIHELEGQRGNYTFYRFTEQFSKLLFTSGK